MPLPFAAIPEGPVQEDPRTQAVRAAMERHGIDPSERAHLRRRLTEAGRAEARTPSMTPPSSLEGILPAAIPDNAAVEEQFHLSQGRKADGSEQPGWVENVARTVGGSLVSGTGRLIEGTGNLASAVNRATINTDMPGAGALLDLVGQSIREYGEGIQAGRSDDVLAAVEATMSAEDISLKGMIYGTLQVLGEMAPIIMGGVAGAAARGAAAGGRVAGSIGAAQTVQGMHDATVEEMTRIYEEKGFLPSPMYQALIEEGATPDEAFQATVTAGAALSSFLALPVGYIGGRLESALATGGVGAVRNAGGRAARMGTGAGIGAGVEAGQENLESIGSYSVAELMAGADVDLLQSAAGDTLMAVLAGGTIGAVGGVRGPRPDAQTGAEIGAQAAQTTGAQAKEDPAALTAAQQAMDPGQVASPEDIAEVERVMGPAPDPNAPPDSYRQVGATGIPVPDETLVGPTRPVMGSTTATPSPQNEEPFRAPHMSPPSEDELPTNETTLDNGTHIRVWDYGGPTVEIEISDRSGQVLGRESLAPEEYEQFVSDSLSGGRPIVRQDAQDVSEFSGTDELPSWLDAMFEPAAPAAPETVSVDASAYTDESGDLPPDERGRNIGNTMFDMADTAPDFDPSTGEYVGDAVIQPTAIPTEDQVMTKEEEAEAKQAERLSPEQRADVVRALRRADQEINKGRGQGVADLISPKAVQTPDMTPNRARKAVTNFFRQLSNLMKMHMAQANDPERKAALEAEWIKYSRLATDVDTAMSGSNVNGPRATTVATRDILGLFMPEANKEFGDAEELARVVTTQPEEAIAQWLEAKAKEIQDNVPADIDSGVNQENIPSASRKVTRAEYLRRTDEARRGAGANVGRAANRQPGDIGRDLSTGEELTAEGSEERKRVMEQRKAAYEQDERDLNIQLYGDPDPENQSRSNVPGSGSRLEIVPNPDYDERTNPRVPRYIQRAVETPTTTPTITEVDQPEDGKQGPPRPREPKPLDNENRRAGWQDRSTEGAKTKGRRQYGDSVIEHLNQRERAIDSDERADQLVAAFKARQQRAAEAKAEAKAEKARKLEEQRASEGREKATHNARKPEEIAREKARLEKYAAEAAERVANLKVKLAATPRGGREGAELAAFLKKKEELARALGELPVQKRMADPGILNATLDKLANEIKSLGEALDRRVPVKVTPFGQVEGYRDTPNEGVALLGKKRRSVSTPHILEGAKRERYKQRLEELADRFDEIRELRQRAEELLSYNPTAPSEEYRAAAAELRSAEESLASYKSRLRALGMEESVAQLEKEEAAERAANVSGAKFSEQRRYMTPAFRRIKKVAADLRALARKDVELDEEGKPTAKGEITLTWQEFFGAAEDAAAATNSGYRPEKAVWVDVSRIGASGVMLSEVFSGNTMLKIPNARPRAWLDPETGRRVRAKPITRSDGRSGSSKGQAAYRPKDVEAGYNWETIRKNTKLIDPRAMDEGVNIALTALELEGGFSMKELMAQAKAIEASLARSSAEGTTQRRTAELKALNYRIHSVYREAVMLAEWSIAYAKDDDGTKASGVSGTPGAERRRRRRLAAQPVEKNSDGSIEIVKPGDNKEIPQEAVDRASEELANPVDLTEEVTPGNDEGFQFTPTQIEAIRAIAGGEVTSANAGAVLEAWTANQNQIIQARREQLATLRAEKETLEGEAHAAEFEPMPEKTAGFFKAGDNPRWKKLRVETTNYDLFVSVGDGPDGSVVFRRTNDRKSVIPRDPAKSLEEQTTDMLVAEIDRHIQMKEAELKEYEDELAHANRVRPAAPARSMPKTFSGTVKLRSSRTAEINAAMPRGMPAFREDSYWAEQGMVIEDTAIVDRFGYMSPPSATPSPAIASLSGMRPLQVEGAAKLATAFDNRLKIVAEKGPENVEDAGALLMDGPGLGKTRQLLAFIYHVVQAEKASGRNRKVLVTIPGASDNLLSQWADNAAAMGIRDTLFEPGSIFFKPDLVVYMPHHLIVQMPSSLTSQEYAAVVADEVHMNFMDSEGKLGAAIAAVNTPFHVFSTATPLNKQGQEGYFLKWLQEGKKGASQKSALSAVEEISSKPNFAQAMLEEMERLVRKGLVLSRQLVSNARYTMRMLSPNGDTTMRYDPAAVDIIKRIPAIVNNLGTRPSVEAYMAEHAKVPAMVEEALRQIQDGKQVLAVFAHSNVNAWIAKRNPDKDLDKELEPFRTAPVVRFIGDLRAKLRAAGIPISAVEGFYGSANDKGAQADPAAQKRFQAGLVRVLAVTDQKAGTGFDFDDSSGPMAPRVMLLSRTRDSAQDYYQVLGRIDRAGTRTVPEVIFFGIDKSISNNPGSDAHWRGSIKAKLALLDMVTGKASSQTNGAQLSVYPELHDPETESEFIATPAGWSMADAIDPDTSDAGRLIRERVRENPDAVMTPTELFDLIEANGTEHERVMARWLRKLNVGPLGVFTPTSVDAEYGAWLATKKYGGVYNQGDAKRPQSIVLNPSTSLDMARVFMHEYGHAATATYLRATPTAQTELQVLMGRMPASLKRAFQQAFKNEREFVAEAFGNAEFQMELKRMPGQQTSSGSMKSLWDQFVMFVRRLLGVPVYVNKTLFEQVVDISIGDRTGNLSVPPRFGVVPDLINSDFLPDVDRLSRALNVMPTGRRRDVSMKAYRAMLPTLTLKQMVDNIVKFTKAGAQRGGRILQELRAAIEAKAATITRLNDEYKKQVLVPVEEFAKGAGQKMVTVTLGPGQEPEKMTLFNLLALIMNASGYASVDFSRDRADSANSVLGFGGKAGATKETIIRARAYWDAYKPIFDNELGPEGREIYKQLASYFQTRKKIAVRTLAGMYLDTVVPRADGSSWVNQTYEDQRKEIKALKELLVSSPEQAAQMSVSSDQLDRLRDVLETGIIRGAYFPLKRYGDKIVTITHTLESEDPDEVSAFVNRYPGAMPRAKGDKRSGGATYLEVHRFESYEEANAFIAEAKKRFPPDWVSNEPMLSYDSLWKRPDASISSHLINRFGSRLEHMGVDEKDKARMLREFTLAMLDLAPESSMASTLRTRKGREGASLDILRGLNDYGAASSRYLAAMMHSKTIRERRAELGSYLAERTSGGLETDKLSAVAGQIDDRMDKLEEGIELGKMGQIVSDMAFMWNLVGASYNAINGTQPWMVSYPEMAGRHGFKEAAVALNNAYKEIRSATVGTNSRFLKTWGSLKELGSLAAVKGTRHDFDTIKNYSTAADMVASVTEPRHKALLEYMIEHGKIDVSQGMDMASRSNRAHVDSEGRPIKQSKWSYLTDWMRMAPHAIEVTSRGAVSIAAFDLEFKRLMQNRKDGQTDEEIFAAARDYAIEVVDTTLFIYADYNKAPMLMGKLTRLTAGMFMQHVQHMYYFMFSRIGMAFGKGNTTKEEAAEARKALAAFTGMHFLAAGAIGGTPELLKLIIYLGYATASSLGLADDDPFEWELMVQNQMMDLLGGNKTLADMASRGVLAGIGIDISGRVGINQMIMFESPDFSSQSAMYESIARTATGATGSMVANMVEGMREVSGGDVLRGAERMAPKAIRDVMGAVRMNQEGMTDRYGRTYAGSPEINWWDMPGMMAGFRDTEVSDMQLARTVSFMERTMQRRRSEIYQDAFEAAKAGRGVAAVMPQIEEWNRRNPEMPIKVKEVIKSIRENRRREAEAVNGVVVGRGRRDWVEEKTRFMG